MAHEIDPIAYDNWLTRGCDAGLDSADDCCEDCGSILDLNCDDEPVCPNCDEPDGRCDWCERAIPAGYSECSKCAEPDPDRYDIDF